MCVCMRFYKNMMPDIPVALCQGCGRFFHEVRIRMYVSTRVFLCVRLCVCMYKCAHICVWVFR